MNELYEKFLDFLIEFEKSDCLMYAKDDCRGCPLKSVCSQLSRLSRCECFEDLKKRKEERACQT
jgi:hypothetical protein